MELTCMRELSLIIIYQSDDSVATWSSESLTDQKHTQDLIHFL